MFFKKNPTRIGQELGQVVFSDPIIDTLWTKAEKQKCEKEMHSIIAFARLVSIKYFFPTSQAHIDPWSTMSSTMDDYYFGTLERNAMNNTFEIRKMGTDEERYHVCHHLDIPFTPDDRTHTTFETFIGCAVTNRYNRYIELLDDGFTSTGNNIKNIECYAPLADAVADDLTFLFKANGDKEIIGSIAPAAMHGLSILSNHGLYD